MIDTLELVYLIRRKGVNYSSYFYFGGDIPTTLQFTLLYIFGESGPGSFIFRESFTSTQNTNLRCVLDLVDRVRRLSQLPRSEVRCEECWVNETEVKRHRRDRKDDK